MILRKGGNSHKRFTSQFAVTAAGEFLRPHILFLKLVNRPWIPPRVICDVKPTDMWNDTILWNCLKSTMLARTETAFSQELVLLILDAYKVHKSFVESGQLKPYNLIPILVLERLTSILQPRRGYQYGLSVQLCLPL
jgi:hypothetical protein